MFWGHMLRRHSNPTKNKGLVAPAQQGGKFDQTIFENNISTFTSIIRTKR